MKILVRYDDLAGRRALVTGASSGIGLGAAEALLAQGAQVAVHWRSNRAAADALAGRHPGRAFPIQAELGTEAGCVAAVREAAAAMGGLDLLVHSAGIWNDGPIATLTAARLEEIFRVNAFSAFYLVRDALPHLRAGPARGAVVFVGSTAGERGEAGHSHYAATKGALQSLAMSLAVELAPEVRVNLVSPGWVRTPMTEPDLESDVGRAIVATLPNRRVAEVEDVVHAILYLASEASGHLLGADLGVSGGALLVVPRGQVVPREG
jgi:3-oxoacyl-[acyl-carrier protein] reductase